MKTSLLDNITSYKRSMIIPHIGEERTTVHFMIYCLSSRPELLPFVPTLKLQLPCKISDFIELVDLLQSTQSDVRQSHGDSSPDHRQWKPYARQKVLNPPFYYYRQVQVVGNNNPWKREGFQQKHRARDRGRGRALFALGNQGHREPRSQNAPHSSAADLQWE